MKRNTVKTGQGVNLTGREYKSMQKKRDTDQIVHKLDRSNA